MALVLVLAFVVLLSGLVLAFFSRAMSDRQVANSSTNQTKVELFAQGALDTIVGDLKQEMAAGAASPAPSPLPAGVTLYFPSAATAVPCRVGTDPTLPNLVKTSASGQAFYSTSATATYNTTAYPPSNRASAIPSTTPSQNGRVVSAKRWNYHYLLPKNTPTSDTDASPIKAFTAPNWVMAARNGTNPGSTATTAGFGTGGVNDPTPANGNYVVGRYAYAIYDEGGLLDMNVAGYPSGITPTQMACKPAVAFADLTQLPVVSNPMSYPGDYLPQAQVDQIVGWRNYASAAPTGTFPNFTFGTGPATNYYNLVVGNWSGLGFLTTANTLLSSGQSPGQSDRMFPDRQSLMRLLIQGLGGSGTPSPSVTRANLQNAMQYMGTFSCELNQPSYCPSPNLPKVQNLQTTNANPYGYGNDVYNIDRYNTSTGATPAARSPYDINPPFPAVTVLTSFTRLDGTTANVGDPLIKYRFPLSRLAWLTYKGPSAYLSTSDPLYNASGTPAAILASFGLTWDSTNTLWTYNHGNPSGILRLSYPTGQTISAGVAQLVPAREPDFFEMLRAAINVGSVGKTFWGPNDVVGSGTYVQEQYSRDVLTSLQILQIGADIVDQYDSDSFPTRITFSGNDTNNTIVDPSRVVAGVEDLPYIYHMRNRLAWKDASTARWMMQPVLWNPHDPSSGTPVAAPTLFCVTAKQVLPAETEQLQVQYNHSTTVPTFPLDWASSTPTFKPIVFSAGVHSGFYDFRQPTLMAETNVPANTYSSGNDFKSTIVDPNVSLIGIVAAQFPLKDTGVAGPPLSYAWNVALVGPPSGVEFDLCYYPNNNANTTPVPYNSFIAYWDGLGSITGGYDCNKFTYSYSSCGTDAQEKSYVDSQWANTATYKAIDTGTPNTSLWWGMSRIDPRTSRWSTQTAQYANSIPYVTTGYAAGYGLANNVYETHRGGVGISFGNHHTKPSDFTVNGESSTYASAYQYRGFQYAYWAENSIRNTVQTDSETNYKRFNFDPDGIARRAVGGYATDTNAGGGTASTNTAGLPEVTNNFTSRPLVLNRPFQSVAELGYAFRGEPWKDLNFSSPESGDTALLDVFCLNELSNTNAEVAGKVNLNTRQAPVLQALLAGANYETTSSTSVITGSTAAQQLAAALVARTTSQTPNGVPLTNRADLVGAWTSPSKSLTTTTNNPDQYFSGFTSDIATATIQAWSGQPQLIIKREREAAIRALTDAGSTRTWNLLIDVVAQTGRYPSNVGNSSDPLASFLVDGEKRYWLHVAIDRITGAIVDEKLESVNE